jgi:hypothetical protein
MQRKHFMTEADKKAMGNAPRTHQNCFERTGKNRPGKTAYERYKKGK